MPESDLTSIALENRARAAATVKLGERAASNEIGAFVYGYRCAAQGQPEPAMVLERMRECCRMGYAAGAASS